MRQIQKFIRGANVAIVVGSKVSAGMLKNQIDFLCNTYTYNSLEDFESANLDQLDLIVTDRFLPNNRKAEDLVRLVKERVPFLPTIIVTSNEWLDWELQDTPPDFVLPKPIPGNLLVEIASQLILLSKERELRRDLFLVSASPEIAGILEKLASKTGAKILKTDNPAKILEGIRELHHRTKAVFLEGEDAFETAKRAREEGFIHPIFVIGKRSFADVAEEAFMKGITLYIPLEELQKTSLIERLLETRRAESHEERLFILLVEDSPLMREILTIGIFNQGYPVAAVESAEDALRILKLNKMLLSVINLNLPGKNGLKLVEELKDLPRKDYEKLAMTYTSSENPIVAFEAIFSGADDFLRAPFTLCDLYVRMHNLIRLRRHLHELEKSREQLYQMGTQDPMTKLYNRRFLIEVIEKSLEAYKRYGNPFSLIMIDVNWFKQINDTYGHNVGDAVLIHIANQLKELVRKTDVVARYGGDEFLILLPETEKDNCEELANRIKDRINGTSLEGHPEIKLSISTGCASVSELEEEELNRSTRHAIHTLINLADRRMYEDKRRTKSRLREEA